MRYRLKNASLGDNVRESPADVPGGGGGGCGVEVGVLGEAGDGLVRRPLTPREGAITESRRWKAHDSYATLQFEGGRVTFAFSFVRILIMNLLWN